MSMRLSAKNQSDVTLSLSRAKKIWELLVFSIFMTIHKNQALHFSTIFMTGYRGHVNVQNSGDPFFFNFHDPGYMKMYKNQALCFSSIFMTPGCMKIHKNQVLCFSSIFMTPIKHENVHKSGAPFFYNFHENVQKSGPLFFFNFHDPRMHENSQKSGALFFFNFHDPDKTWKCTQIRCSIFLQFSWKCTKIRRSVFLQFSWPSVHDNSQKSCALFFSNFHDPEVMKIHKNQAKGKTKLTESPIVFITPYQQCLAVCSMMQFEAQTSLYVFKLVYCHIGEAESSIESSTSRNRNKTRPQP